MGHPAIFGRKMAKEKADSRGDDKQNSEGNG
jgi:hypothetical protein